jgi:hypothetical protein
MKLMDMTCPLSWHAEQINELFMTTNNVLNKSILRLLRNIQSSILRKKKLCKSEFWCKDIALSVTDQKLFYPLHEENDARTTFSVLMFK